jgi:hypothetical protein
VSAQKMLRVSDPAHVEFTRIQYRIASDTGKRPTASELTTALTILGNRYYSDLLFALGLEGESET